MALGKFQMVDYQACKGLTKDNHLGAIFKEEAQKAKEEARKAQEEARKAIQEAEKSMKM